MRNDVECPYCGAGMEIDYSGRVGREDKIYDRECDGCGKTFAYDVTITISHTAWKAPCLNGGEHNWWCERRHPLEYSRMKCAVCGDTRELTEKEREENEIEERLKKDGE
jgi:hypothetical protein